MLSKAKCLEMISLPTPFIVGPVNIYLIKGDALTLVDTGPKTREAKETLVHFLKKHGLSANDVDQIVLTHHHPDHVGLIEDVFPKAKIVGHKKCQPWLQKKEQFLSYVESYIEIFYRQHGVPEKMIEEMILKNRYYLSFTGNRGLDRFVSDGDKIEGLTGWTVVETPGHAQSHICLYNEKDHLLIGGDHIIDHISSNALLEPPIEKSEERPKTLLQYRASLEKCLQLQVKKVYSGHGVPVESINELIELRFKETEEKINRLIGLLSNEEMTSFELCKKYFAHIYKKEPTLTMSEIIGHLDLMVERGNVKLADRDGQIFYY